jgi:ATP-dependent helicase/nuclease subunit B
MSALFAGPAPRIRAAPASAAFLDLMASEMVDALYRADDPFSLSDALVLLPNRRAARGLMDAFARKLGGAALLPAIRPLGDPHVDDDPDVWGADPIGDDIAPPIDKLARRMELAALIRRRDKAENGVEDPVRALALADELARLLDSAATVDHVAWDQLPTLVTELELARHWERSAAFLDIVATYWPLMLEERGQSDFAAHGAAIRKALAARWALEPPQRPVIIAGSTGSIATTRELMGVVARLPQGVVILPGLDTDLDDGAWEAVGDQHPQFALKETLAALGVSRRDIAPFGEETQKGRARRVLMREALAPAEKTADWLQRLAAAGGAAFVAEGAEGLHLVEAATEDQEAACIALLMREALETPGRTVALVTPDVGLARRVESKLARWGVAPAVSHGRPLRESEAGALIALLCDLAHDPGDPISLAGLFKHPRVALAQDETLRAAIEHKALRGPRKYETLADLAALLGENTGAKAVIACVGEALSPLIALRGEINLSQFTDALIASADALTGGIAWAGADGENTLKLLQEANAHGAALGPMRAHAAPRVVLQLMQGRETPPAPGDDARAAIWGPLEARLQRRDLMILGGLNEGVWPAPAPEDPFLSRPMRAKLGLPSHDQRVGLAAHDFAQLISGPEVVLTRALRREGAPTLASRWLWRLKTLVKGAKAELRERPELLAWAHKLDQPRSPRAPKPPRPRQGRLERISVTQVETLIRDPYAVYATRILGLQVLDPIGQEASHRERGTAMHKAIERFEDGEDRAEFLALLDEELKRHGIAPERRAAEEERLIASADVLIEWFAARRAKALAVFRECKGVLDVAGVELSGVADRIEIGPGHAAVLDFKTGKPPSVAQVQSFAPQLPLEAAMLARGVFEHEVDGAKVKIAPAQTTELGYWWFGGAKPQSIVLALDPIAEGEKALANLATLLTRYEKETLAFLCKPRVQFLKSHTGRVYTDYDQLARRKEWADADGGEE